MYSKYPCRLRCTAVLPRNHVCGLKDNNERYVKQENLFGKQNTRKNKNDYLKSKTQRAARSLTLSRPSTAAIIILEGLIVDAGGWGNEGLSTSAASSHIDENLLSYHPSFLFAFECLLNFPSYVGLCFMPDSSGGIISHSYPVPSTPEYIHTSIVTVPHKVMRTAYPLS